jgi:predicted lipid carrier protein YhbT
MDLPPRQRGERGLKMLRAHLIGPKDGPVVADPEATEILFDTVRRQADPSRVAPGTTIQWEFPDAEPWFLRCANGSTAVRRGRAPHADVTLRLRFEDFADIVALRADPRALLLRRRIRLSGSPRVMLRLPKLLG